MIRLLDIRQELKDQVEAIRSGSEEATVALRALYALYFANKTTATTDEKRLLLGESFEFSLNSGVPYAQDKAIFAQEAKKHYHPEQ